MASSLCFVEPSKVLIAFSTELSAILSFFTSHFFRGEKREESRRACLEVLPQHKRGRVSQRTIWSNFHNKRFPQMPEEFSGGLVRWEKSFCALNKTLKQEVLILLLFEENLCTTGRRFLDRRLQGALLLERILSSSQTDWV